MTSWAAFLRALNVGGTGKAAMADVRRVASGIGFADVRTHLASGNLIFEHDTAQRAELEALLEAALVRELSLRTVAIARTCGELRDVLAANPLAVPSGELQVAFRKDPGAALDPAAAANLARAVVPDAFAVGSREVYLHFPNGQARTKLTAGALERALGTAVTIRGVRTIQGVIAKF